MIATLRLPQQLRLELPLRQDASGRFLPWVIALIVYLSVSGGLALIWLSDALHGWDAAVGGALTLQVPADTSTARLEMTLGALKQTKGVVDARLLDTAETAKLIQPWLGNSFPLDSLPLPRLIDVQVDPDVAIDFATLRRQLASIVPNAQLDNNTAAPSDVPRFAGRVEWTIAIGIVAVTALLVAIIVFAARIGLAIHRSLIELLHLLGAADEYIARQFQIHALWLGLRGAIIGGIAAAVTAMILEPAAGRLALPVPAVSSGILDWRLWLLLCVALVIAGGVAMVTARVTVLRQLARLP